ncbi:MAG: VRR-NUC domain-containing protein [Methanoregula sp.]|jgi:hypothetical protein|nr:VRR-NUC domain-containing protein [Methanoregula sp.]
MKSREANLQSACVKYFRYQYPKLAGVFFHVPNGGSRNAIEAKNLKIQGVVPGVADLILLKPSGQYSSLCIEMKAGTGRQSESQKQFQQAAEKAGNKYVIVRTFEEFVDNIHRYLNNCSEYITGDGC